MSFLNFDEYLEVLGSLQMQLHRHREFIRESADDQERLYWSERATLLAKAMTKLQQNRPPRS